jgi:hypothetical protein
MKRLYAVFAVIFVLMLIGIQAVEVSNANPYYFPVPSMKIISPPDPPNRYENSTVSLEVEVYMRDESPKLQRIYYSLDGAPSVYLDFTTTRSNSYNVDYTANAKADMENISEGSHKIVAYSVDVNGKVMSTSRTFSVDSRYQVTVIKILSPLNITYSKKEIPLIFTVNGEFKNATYGFLPPSTTRVNVTAIAGNTTLTGLSDGFNKILLYAFADDKGGSRAYLEFTINSTQANNSLALENSTSFIIIVVVIVTVAIASISLVYFKKRKGKP